MCFKWFLKKHVTKTNLRQQNVPRKPFFGVWGRHHPLTQPNGTLWIPGCFNRFNRFNPEAYMASTSSWSQRFKSPPRSPKPIAGPLVVPSKPRERVMRSQSLQSSLATNKNPPGNGLIRLFRGKKSIHRSQASLKLTAIKSLQISHPKRKCHFPTIHFRGELLILGRVDGFKRFLVFLPQSLKKDDPIFFTWVHTYFSRRNELQARNVGSGYINCQCENESPRKKHRRFFQISRCPLGLKIQQENNI